MAETMRAVQLFAPGDVRLMEVPVPKVMEPNDVLVRIKAVGVCGSDIPRVMVKGAYRYPITIGHEFSGEVVEAGKASHLSRGARVTCMPLLNCGVCPSCQVGEYVTCDDYDYYGSRKDGAIADYILVRAENCLELPTGVDYEEGSMTDPAAVALHAARKLPILPGMVGVVFGLGAIGYFAMQWLREMGCIRVIAVDVEEDKLQLAKTLGATDIVNAAKEDSVAAIKKLTNGVGADVAVELSGVMDVQVQSIDCLKKRGSVVFCGISYKDLVLPNKVLQKLLREEIIVRGSWNSSIAPLPINEWATVLQFMASGRLRMKELITHRFAYADAQKAFEMMLARKESFTKVLFKPEL